MSLKDAAWTTETKSLLQQIIIESIFQKNTISTLHKRYTDTEVSLTVASDTF